MTEAFAATSAQVIPVIVLTLVIEFRHYIRFLQERLAPDTVKQRPRLALFAFISALAVIAAAPFLALAEMICLSRLAGVKISTQDAAFVSQCIRFCTYLVFVIPLFASAAQILRLFPRREPHPPESSS